MTQPSVEYRILFLSPPAVREVSREVWWWAAKRYQLQIGDDELVKKLEREGNIVIQAVAKSISEQEFLEDYQKTIIEGKTQCQLSLPSSSFSLSE